MKIMSVLALLSWSTLASAARPDPIEQVVVFGDRAQVTRKTTVSCKADQATAHFFPLPMGLFSQSLRGEAKGGATAIGTTSGMAPVQVADDVRLGPLQAEVDRLDEALKKAQSARQLVEAAGADAVEFRSYLASVLGEGLRNTKPSTTDWGRALDVLRREARGRVDELATLGEVQQRLGRKRALVTRQIALLGEGRGIEAWSADVAVRCGGAATVVVRLSYIVPGATWKPEYDLRFEPKVKGRVGPGRVELGVSAVVQQATGEDWVDVRLVLSSARPWLGIDAAKLKAMRIDGRAATKDKVLVQARERREEARIGGGLTGAGPTGVVLEDGGQSITLTLPHTVRVISDGRPYWMPVDQRRARGTARLVSVPKKSDLVYQLVQFKNPAPYPLMAGRLHTWRSGTYVGDTQLRHTGPGAAIEASLGIDESFRVDRVVVEDSTRRPGFLSSTRTLPRSYAIKIKSRTRHATRVEVRENIPVSKAGDVKVTLLKARTTAGYDLDAMRGFVRWTVKVPGNGEETVKFAYQIKLPEDWKVN